MYLLNEHEIEKVAKGEMTVEEATGIERLVLITWTGEDIVQDCEGNNIKVLDMDAFIEQIKYRMGKLNCGDCFDMIMHEEVEELLKVQKEDSGK